MEHRFPESWFLVGAHTAIINFNKFEKGDILKTPDQAKVKVELVCFNVDINKEVWASVRCLEAYNKGNFDYRIGDICDFPLELIANSKN